MRRTLAAGAAAVLAAAALVAVQAGTAHAAWSGIWADFNGDGYRDVVVTAPHARVNGVNLAGAITVMYGGPKGIQTARHAVITEAAPGVPGSPLAGREFGLHAAIGDLDGDGHADLVVSSYAVKGQPHDLTVLWGSSQGLTSGTFVAHPARNHGVVSSLMVADFDADHHADIALAMDPLSSEYTTADNHGLWVLRGGVTRAGATAGTYALPKAAGFTTEITAGDITGDGISDLVAETTAGVPGATDPVSYSALFEGGRGRGLTASATDVPAGTSADIGDLNFDGRGDLVVGQPWGKRLGGSVTVVYGAPSGLGTGVPSQVIDQDTPGVPGTAEAEDAFGMTVRVGDVDGDGAKDIAVGVPYEDIGTSRQGRDAGALTVLRGSPQGVTGGRSQTFAQNKATVPGGSDPADYFGYTAGLSDTDRDGRADLVVAAFDEDGGVGSVWSFRAAFNSSGISTTGVVRFGPVDVGLVKASYPHLGQEIDL